MIEMKKKKIRQIEHLISIDFKQENWKSYIYIFTYTCLRSFFDMALYKACLILTTTAFFTK